MSRKATRNLLFLALIALGGLLMVQIVWFQRAFNLQEEQFNQKVNLAIREASHNVLLENGDTISVIPAIEQTASNQFFMQIGFKLGYVDLMKHLDQSFIAFGIREEFNLALYDCDLDQLLLGSRQPRNMSDSLEVSCLTRSVDPECYRFSVTFPGKQAHLLGSMKLWLGLVFTFLLVLIYFAYSLYVMLKEKRLAEMRKDFINNLTHELKTPIANIGVASEVLKKAEPGLNIEKTIRYATIIHQENERLKKQVDQVLQMAFMENQGLELKLEKIDLNELIEEIVASLVPRVSRRNGLIAFKKKAGQSYVMGDRFHLTNVLYSLIDNADKYSPQEPEISVSTQMTKEGLWINIADRGIGIAREWQQYIFDRFYRVPTGDVHDIKGFGLGLSYAKLVVEAHGGTIKVDSQPNEGSTFRVLIVK